MDNLGARVREVRLSKGIMGIHIAKALGKKPSWLSAREHGHTDISAIELRDIARVLDVSMEVFFAHNSQKK
jgi:transcriptional regulator with XRE-family HTH domain